MVTDDKEITIADLIFFLKKYFLVIVLLLYLISLIAYFGSAFYAKILFFFEISFFSSTGSSVWFSKFALFRHGRLGNNPFDGFKKNDSNFVDLNELLKSKRLLISVAEKKILKIFIIQKLIKLLLVNWAKIFHIQLMTKHH